MELYFKPPEGNISFNNLCRLVKSRFICLCFIRGKSVDEIDSVFQKRELVESSDCLIEGTIKDKISHFTLRLVCATDKNLRNFFIDSEIKLFLYRLKFYQHSDIQELFKRSHKKINQVLKLGRISKSYRNILLALLVVSKNFEFALENKCNLKVPFILALNFVQHRVYPLHFGNVEIPLDEIKSVLSHVFENIIKQGIIEMQTYSLSQLQDPCIVNIRTEIQKWFNQHGYISILPFSKRCIILETNLNKESQKFPFCMKILHVLLRQNHRLPHSSRIQYILFLKEIGVPCDQVIDLFMKEYSIPINRKTNDQSSCRHLWNDNKNRYNKNRYIYGIEHLFGNRGSRINYKGHGCHSLQSYGSSTLSIGGCPFVYNDFHRLNILNNDCCFKTEDIEDIKLLSSEKKFGEACKRSLIQNARKYHVLEMCSTETCMPERDIPNLCPKKSKNDSSTKKNSLAHNAYSLNKSTVFQKPSDYYFWLSSIS